MNTPALYFPDLQTAHAHCSFYFDSFNLPWTAKEYPHREQCVSTYRHERTRQLLGIIDRVTITPDDISQVGGDLSNYTFTDDFAQAYFFTPLYRK